MSSHQQQWWCVQVGKITFNREHFLPALQDAGFNSSKEEIHVRESEPFIRTRIQSKSKMDKVRTTLISLPNLDAHPRLSVRHRPSSIRPTNISFRPMSETRARVKRLQNELIELTKADDEKSSVSFSISHATPQADQHLGIACTDIGRGTRSHQG